MAGQGRYLAQGYPAQDGYGQPQIQHDGGQAVSPPVTVGETGQGAGAGAGAGARKKRAYAGQAYEFGAGANSALGGQQQGGGQYSGFSQQQHEAGYPQGGYQQTPAAVQQGPIPVYGHQDAGGVGGYQSAAPTYPTPGITNAIPGAGVAGMTQQFSQIDMSQKPPQQQSQQQRTPVLNQLYPTDLLNQPFNPAALEYPPPPAILPPNVSSTSLGTLLVHADLLRRASHLLLMPTVHRSTSDRH